MYVNLEFYSSDKLRKEVEEIIRRYLKGPEWKIFFFGSRVKGDNFPSADIDLGIEGPEQVPLDIKSKIREELERIPVLYKFDLVDFKTVPDDFREKALEFVEYVH